MAIGPHAESESEVLEKREVKGAADGRVHVSVVTPRGTLLDKVVDEVVAPGVEGELGVLPGHVAFLTALKTGPMVIRDGSHRSHFAVGPGFLEVGAGGLTRVLVGEAVSADEIDVDKAKADAGELAETLRTDGGRPPEENAALQARLAWARAQVAAYTASQKA